MESFLLTMDDPSKGTATLTTAATTDALFLGLLKKLPQIVEVISSQHVRTRFTPNPCYSKVEIAAAIAPLVSDLIQRQQSPPA